MWPNSPSLPICINYLPFSKPVDLVGIWLKEYEKFTSVSWVTFGIPPTNNLLRARFEQRNFGKGEGNSAVILPCLRPLDHWGSPRHFALPISRSQKSTTYFFGNRSWFITSIIFHTLFSILEFIESISSYFQRTSPGLIKVVHYTERVGLIRARLAGARVAIGEILFLLDAHVEVTDGWYENNFLYLLAIIHFWGQCHEVMPSRSL